MSEGVDFLLRISGMILSSGYGGAETPGPREEPTMAANLNRYLKLKRAESHSRRSARLYAEVSALGFDAHGPVSSDSSWLLKNRHEARADRAAALADREFARGGA